ncbi:trk system potassium uptake protein TrkA [Methanomicrobium sp. W14]|uniref:potassium channel family protein n=1 Tax=Methanomicrobium sp. W14 TaxID=2817839 RepID=UPI001AE5C1A4|nr:TrkA family potassium uptake protein [Methanomicrobium sp. W14]MBP2132665.1 trk system potassium uptake protein TrkA [Methanomicrobium sp. W14]
MRVIIVGASALGLDLSRMLIKRGYEVVLIEQDSQTAESLSESMDCTVINAEGTSPDILEKAEIGKADAIVACGGHDQDNILTGLIARGYNVPDIIITTKNTEFMNVAKKLGFHHVVNPPQTASVSIYNTLKGIDTIELSTMMRGNVRFISIIAGESHKGEKLSDIQLPKKSEFIGLYRNDDFFLVTENPAVEINDELLIVTLSEHVTEIDEIFRDYQKETIQS